MFMIRKCLCSLYPVSPSIALELSAPLLCVPRELSALLHSIPRELSAPLLSIPLELLAPLHSIPLELSAPLLSIPRELSAPLLSIPCEVSASLLYLLRCQQHPQLHHIAPSTSFNSTRYTVDAISGACVVECSYCYTYCSVK